MEKIYRVQMNSKGMPNFATAEEIPQGEWIFRREFVEDTPFTGYRCSNCNYWKSMGAWNYCPNCGARMKGADDETTD